jgi:Holliday junction resolvase RusA-like endonuclease
MTPTIRFTVLGIPAQKGSKIPMKFTRRNPAPGQQKHGIHQHEADKNLPAWTNAVAWAARQAYKGEPTEKPVIVRYSVFLPYFSNGNPCMEVSFDKMIELGIFPIAYHDGDTDKHARAILDAMTKIIYKDDVQVCGIGAAVGKLTKYYACEGYPLGVVIEIEYL